MKSLTRKLGPLPLWGWAVAGVGGFLVYRHFAAGSSTDPNADPNATDAGTYAAGDPYGAGSYYGGGGGVTTIRVVQPRRRKKKKKRRVLG